MARTKLKRIKEVTNFNNVFSYSDLNLKELIRNYFKEAKLFTLEIGCGHGDYSIELAQKFPRRNFIGIDVKAARIYNGAFKAMQLNLTNVAFVIAKAEKLLEILELNSIEEIYIPFPDPHPRRTSQERRLISSTLLSIYKELLCESGIIHFKTDNQRLFDYGLKSVLDFGAKILHSTENLYDEKDSKNISDVLTSFEKHYIKEGRSIKYLCFRF